MFDKPSLIEAIAKTDMFSIFSRLMGTSGANEIFSTGKDFTVFAPTNDAFGKIPERQMEKLLNERDQVGLKKLLSYHIVAGKLFAPNFSGQRSRVTMTGDEVKFSDLGTLKVNTANVQARNIEADNGVIHAIDTVLAPPIRSVATSSIL
ncbi:MAG TPA: fasciclin domain-containing protein [Pyrinomonadaceae bacterium]|jgi:uncharacterized surface protein with fasciclin (FAS1) repeats|nr:fasciclin domain-containing protein [Pyrinomonadaceae bacterium]